MAATLLLVYSATGCRDDRLQPGEGQVQLLPAALELGEVYAGETASGWLEVQNTGTASLNLSWSVEGEGFSLEGAVDLIPGGTVMPVRVLATRATVGAMRGAVTVMGPNNTARSDVHAEAVDHPPCNAVVACTQSVWSDSARACVEGPAPDGEPCSDICLENAHCVSGRCVGDEKRCDDDDACTTDVCTTAQGCVHVPAPPCPSDGQCQLGVCDSKKGCGFAPAPDGHGCGRTDCRAADVCIAGACVERDPPDGFVCAQASPCQGEGKCQQDVCVRPAATALAPSWDFGGPLEDGGMPDPLFSDLMLSPTGDLTLSGYFSAPPLLMARSAEPVELSSAARRCLYWGAVLACADHPNTVAAGVSVIDMATGKPKWTYGSVLADLPSLVGANRNTFLARLVVLSATRLAAVFETRTINADGSDGLCRVFSVVVLDRFGARVSAWTISDPLFSICNHPHSYGAASDAAGNLYFAFTPSANTNPAEPTVADTLFISFSELGQQRWKTRIATLLGGEIAVANGMLVHQHSVMGLSTADGMTAGVLSTEFRNGVMSRDAVVPSPQVGDTTLLGFSPSGLTARWSYSLPAGQSFTSEVARLASWSTKNGPQEVVLGFSRAASEVSLVAVHAQSGQEAFVCPLAEQVNPLLVEVGSASLAVMSAYQPPPGCVICDPRYAGTRNRFWWYPLPLIEPSGAPWPGYLGGPGHDHHED